MATCLRLSAIYCICFIPEKYECSTILYYPERVSDKSDSVSDKELMDVAVEVVKQKHLLASVEDKTDSDWEDIRDGLSVSGVRGKVILHWIKMIKFSKQSFLIFVQEK